MWIKSFALALLACHALGSLAQTDVQQRFGNYILHYSVFNSSFIDPQIADLHNITRGDNIALVNIAVTRATAGGESLGLAASVSGRMQNLIMQSRQLDFREISEGQATYYLAAFRIDNGDPQHFFITVQPEDSNTPLELEFTRTLYTD